MRGTVRHVGVSRARACPYQELFRQVYTNLRGAACLPPVVQGG